MMMKRIVFAVCMGLCCNHLHAQDAANTDSIIDVPASPIGFVDVKGSIADAVNRKPLSGARVTYKNATAAITDSLGNFLLKVPGYNVSIRIEADGYQTRELALQGMAIVKGFLHENDYSSFYDDITTPLGITTKSYLSNASVSVQTKGNWQGTPETPDAYLQGKVAGLNAIRRSGTPNIGANLFLRGYTSLYASNQPLIIVDGVFFDNSNYGTPLSSGAYNNPLAFIDSKDIDNITVIKDATSIYGAKGANGVILITTARSKQEATRIDVALYGGVNFEPESIPMMNASDYRVYLSEMLQSKGVTDKGMQALPYMNDDVNNPDYYRYHYTNNWQKKVLDNSTMQNGYLRITGGDNIAKYALTMGFLKNAGVVKNTGLTRYNMRFNADLNLSPRLTAAANLSFIYNEQKLKNMGLSLTTNPLYTALIKAPFLPENEVADNGIESPVLADRDTFNISNPGALIQSMQALNKSYRFNGSVKFNYLLTKQLSLASTIAVSIDKIRESFFVPEKGIVPDTLDNAIAYNRSGAQVIRTFTIFNDTRLAYNKTFNHIHQLDAQLGIRYVRNNAEQDNGFGFNAATDQLKGVQYGVNALRRIGGSLGQWTWLNTYLHAGYNMAGKYYVAFDMAADGSSRFGRNIPQGNMASLQAGSRALALFPSISGSWLVSSEKFMSRFNFVDLLKVRASIGKTGNDDIGNFTARKYYVAQNLLGISGLVRGNIGNEQLQWESVTKLNAGADIALFNERLNISVDAYRNTSDKMIVYTAASTMSGMNYIVANSGGMRTNGWEAAVQARVIDHKTIKWDVGFNIAQSKSKITKLPAGAFLTDFADGTIITAEGNAPNLFYGYKTAGIFTTDADAAAAGLYNKNANGGVTAFGGGDVRFINTTGNDNVIDENDRQVIGNPNPDFYGAINSRLVYGNWSLDVLFTYSYGNDIYNYTRRQLESMSGYANQTEAVLSRWKTNGQVTSTPKATWGDPMSNSRFSDRWIEDGSYVRLRTVSIAYNVPVKPGIVKYIQVYGTGNNLFTLTKYLGYDPEFSTVNGVFGQGMDIVPEPQYKSVQAGVRIGL
ncbi:SusC/RagA family TonB-linked outer membrane protein [Niastella sp. OAS944]|uniref:SusC/RagA family TonB-linked outer membrane protein n=1 Tax=Niastella sp. OAS944 TaxID=2664089 RepID=UPI00348E546B|nr:TonB-linked SusC/RagA family outer membrane protein [Chitinophagaceae bacterium OAS944]